jgi:predicted nuclease of predicted toxin-antitoxin system
MKFLIDAQLPRRLAHQLRAAGLETTHTLDLPEGNRTTDQALITFSLTQHCVVVRKDSDFVETFLAEARTLEVVAIFSDPNHSAPISIHRVVRPLLLICHKNWPQSTHSRTSC